ncbi:MULTISPECIES: anaerobic ribonucleoside-triphosphate reductase-activating protein [Shewanella]|uniref:Anaerobic ribonucleoside-triphosphate reductase-activating protein n=1 Tax=Shewanella metallivivens TaxID=2872342 RepID=A0ABT5TGJ8_9GAMM|nr:anaerobic ribonucleoside-triphosphate reductase-activating protein [Shewanella metallivivens]MDD8057741.1 anaerobic ribonucleoside-triphosphate reductase-activating protein [Shewanella metallivivens]
MHYSAYHSVDVINGEGTRCTLFVSGCEHACKGCYNQSTWRVDAGHVFSQALEDQIIVDLQDTRISRRGLSLSGGDPLHPANVETILHLVERVRDECPDKDIWLWSGYQLDELSEAQQAVVALVDVLIDGKFEQDKADPALLWRGSSNQIVHRFSRE